jgi:hypothetical protein
VVERARTEISELHLSEKHEVENARSEIDAMRQKEFEHQQKEAEVLRKCSELSALRLKHMHEDRASSEVHVRSKSSALLKELDGLLVNPGANGKGHEGMRVRSMSTSNAKNKETLLNLTGASKERAGSRPPSWSPRTSTAPTSPRPLFSTVATSPPHCSPRTPRTTPRGRRSERDGAADLVQFPSATMLGTMKVAAAASVVESSEGDCSLQALRLSPVPSSGSGSTAGECTTMVSVSPTGSPRDCSGTTSTRASLRLHEPAGGKDKPAKLWKSANNSECTQS